MQRASKDAQRKQSERKQNKKWSLNFSHKHTYMIESAQSATDEDETKLRE